jgi:hypothetical protein
MNLQALLTLVVVVLAALYFLRGTLKSAVGGGCASGCGGCKSETCAVQKLQAIQAELEHPKPGKKPA